MKPLLLTLLAATGLALAGCASAPPQQHRLAYPSGKKSLVVQASLNPAHLVPASSIYPPSITVDSQGLVSIQIALKTPRSRVAYCWEWIGPNGMSMHDPTSASWRLVEPDGRNVVMLSGVSTVANPTAVVLHLRKAKP